MGLLGQSVPERHSMPRFVIQRQSYGLGFGAFADAGKLDTLGGASSVGNRSKHSPLEHDTTASTLAKNLQAGRLASVSRARPPVNPSDAVISGTLFTPFVGIAMQTALDLCWSGPCVD